MTRDPRVDPEPGDVVGKDNLPYRRIVYSGLGNVKYRRLNPGADHDVYGIVFLTTWRKWAKGAEVIYVAK